MNNTPTNKIYGYIPLSQNKWRPVTNLADFNETPNTDKLFAKDIHGAIRILENKLSKPTPSSFTIFTITSQHYNATIVKLEYPITTRDITTEEAIFVCNEYGKFILKLGIHLIDKKPFRDNYHESGFIIDPLSSNYQHTVIKYAPKTVARRKKRDETIRTKGYVAPVLCIQHCTDFYNILAPVTINKSHKKREPELSHIIPHSLRQRYSWYAVSHYIEELYWLTKRLNRLDDVRRNEDYLIYMKRKYDYILKAFRHKSNRNHTDKRRVLSILVCEAIWYKKNIVDKRKRKK